MEYLEELEGLKTVETEDVESEIERRFAQLVDDGFDDVCHGCSPSSH